MQYTRRKTDAKDPDGQLFFSLDPVIQGLGMSLIELNVFHSKGHGLQVKAVVYKNG